MSTKNTDLQRRTLLKGIAIIPAAAAMGMLSGQVLANMLTLDDPTALALQYTEKSSKDGQNCSNCALYNGDATAGTCTIFPGKKVAGAGWCTSWVAK